LGNYPRKKVNKIDDIKARQAIFTKVFDLWMPKLGNRRTTFGQPKDGLPGEGVQA
jgi:hypothetical protein